MGKTASLANIGTIADSSLGFRNRIINGGMTIDQRVNGSVNTGGSFIVDRWQYQASLASKIACIKSSTAPAGFTSSIYASVSSAYSAGVSEAFGLNHKIEGNNVSDLGFGTVNATTVTMSFWVRSSVTGVYSGSLRNSASARSQTFTYTINSANTWEQKNVTIVGDTSGTWLTDTGVGIDVWFDLGSGSNFNTPTGSWATGNYIRSASAISWLQTAGATFYITGVQLEKGSTATSFDYRPYGTELSLCQRYYWQSDALGGAVLFDIYSPTGGSQFKGIVIGRLPVDPRATPTVAVPVSASSNVSLTGFYYTCGVIQPTGSSVSTGRAYIAAGTGSITASMEL